MKSSFTVKFLKMLFSSYLGPDGFPFICPYLPRHSDVLDLTFGDTGRDIFKYFLKIGGNFLIRKGRRVSIDIRVYKSKNYVR